MRTTEARWLSRSITFAKGGGLVSCSGLEAALSRTDGSQCELYTQEFARSQAHRMASLEQKKSNQKQPFSRLFFIQKAAGLPFGPNVNCPNRLLAK